MSLTKTDFNFSGVDHLIELSLMEDIGPGDITTDLIIAQDHIVDAFWVAKSSGVISGLFVAEKVFRKLDNNIMWKPLVNEGEFVEKGNVILEFSGQYRALLTGERTALNFAQRMSGISTMAHEYAKVLERTSCRILDTRKTLPAHRMLDKYAVKVGGGENHRIGLFDMVMIKDNHIQVAGGIKNAIEAVRKNLSNDILIEVETTNIDEVKEALENKANIIMLDNMNTQQMKDAVEFINKRAITEASGSMSIERLKETAMAGVDYISVGALTHSVKAFDISQKIKNQAKNE